MILRRFRRFVLAVAGLGWVILAPPLSGQVPDSLSVSEELARMFAADQADRRPSSPPTAADWAAIAQRDSTRRDRVMELLRGSFLGSADDHYHAAMILQHGTTPEEALLAHILATAAAFDGHAEARWLSAASLDRYLHRTRRPQRFGTQYLRVRLEEPFRIDPSAPWSQGPYIRWLPDDLRARFGVRPLAEQERWVAEQNAPGPDAGS